jgi:hypothetical protein
MSDSHSTVPHSLPAGVEMQDDERLPWSRIGLLAMVALGVFAIGIVFALFVLKQEQGALDQGGQKTVELLEGCDKDPLKCSQVGMVEHKQIELEQRATNAKRKAAERLSSYGWIDKSNNVVHVPIDIGMQRVVNGQRP